MDRQIPKVGGNMIGNNVIILNAKYCVRNTDVELGEKEPGVFGAGIRQDRSALEAKRTAVISNRS